jgi:hypothetical protein
VGTAAGVVLQELDHAGVDRHHRPDRGGMHRVDPDAVLREAVGEGAHQPDYAVLGRRVAQPAALDAAEPD